MPHVSHATAVFAFAHVHLGHCMLCGSRSSAPHMAQARRSAPLMYVHLPHARVDIAKPPPRTTNVHL